MHVSTTAMSLIVLPIALVYVTIGVNQSPASVCFVAYPVSLVARTVEPDLDSSACTGFCVFYPFSFVLSPVFKENNRSFNLRNLIIGRHTIIKRR